MGISVGNKIAFPASLKATHTSISSAFYTKVHPEIIIAQNHFQNIQSACVFIAFFAEVSGTGYILNLSGGGKSLVFLFTAYGFFCDANRFCMKRMLQSLHLLHDLIQRLPFSCITDLQIFRPENFRHKRIQLFYKLLFSGVKILFQLLDKLIIGNTGHSWKAAIGEL